MDKSSDITKFITKFTVDFAEFRTRNDLIAFAALLGTFLSILIAAWFVDFYKAVLNEEKPDYLVLKTEPAGHYKLLFSIVFPIYIGCLFLAFTLWLGRLVREGPRIRLTVFVSRSSVILLWLSLTFVFLVVVSHLSNLGTELLALGVAVLAAWPMLVTVLFLRYSHQLESEESRD